MVRTTELLELVGLLLRRTLVTNRDGDLVVDNNAVTGNFGNHTVGFSDQHFTRVHRGACFEASTNVRSFGNDQRNGLALHVGAHQCALRVVVLHEGNQRRRERDVLNR